MDYSMVPDDASVDFSPMGQPTKTKSIASVNRKKRAIAKNGSSRSILGQKRVGRSMKAANTQFGLP